MVLMGTSKWHIVKGHLNIDIFAIPIHNACFRTKTNHHNPTCEKKPRTICNMILRTNTSFKGPTFPGDPSLCNLQNMNVASGAASKKQQKPSAKLHLVSQILVFSPPYLYFNAMSKTLTFQVITGILSLHMHLHTLVHDPKG